MSTFIVRIELHSSDREQAYSAVHSSMEKAGFSRIYSDTAGVRYHLPASEYCIVRTGTADDVRELAKAAVGKISTMFMLLVSEAARISIFGLVPVKEAGLVGAPSEKPAAPQSFRFAAEPAPAVR